MLSEDKTLFYRLDDDFLTIFLRPCKFYPESAYALMQRIADFKVKHAALIDNLMPSDERAAIMENNVVNVLINRDHKRRRILLVNAGKSWDPSKVTADQMFRIFYLIHEAAVLEPESQVSFLHFFIRCDRIPTKNFDFSNFSSATWKRRN